MPYPNYSFADMSSAVVHQCLQPVVANIMKRCWDQNPDKWPEMHEVGKLLEAINTNRGGGMLTGEPQASGRVCFDFAHVLLHPCQARSNAISSVGLFGGCGWLASHFERR